MANWFAENQILGVVIIVVVVIVLVVALVALLGNGSSKERKLYEKTPYFLEVGTSYDDYIKVKGKKFEGDTYNSLRYKFDKDVHLMANVLLPRKGSMNEYTEIDLLVFHSSGVYCLELKDYKGFVYGNVEHNRWNIGYKKEEKRTVFDFYNPIMQNAKHIEDLCKFFDFPYKNVVVFPNEMYIDTDLRELKLVDELLSLIETGEELYELEDFTELIAKLHDYNTLERVHYHIERIKFNETKYNPHKEIEVEGEDEE